MLNTDMLKDTIIEEEDHDQALQKELGDHKENPIPKGIVSLENLFDLQNYFRGPPNMKVQSSTLVHRKINLKTDTDPRLVNLGSECTP